MSAMQFSNVVRCLCSVVFLVTCNTSSFARAASCQETAGTIVDPILDTGGSLLYYSGNNLEPSANLTYANLTGADSMDLYYSHTYANP